MYLKPFTLIVPAAGKGSRLGYHLPKLLYPVKGTTPLEILMKLFAPYVSRILFIVSPDSKQDIANKLKQLSVDATLLEQEKPLGMVDAILKAAPEVTDDENVIIVWSDQVLLSSDTIRQATQIFERNERGQAFAVLPTASLNDPYVHFERNAQGSLTECRLRREKDLMPKKGESDCGLFLLKGTLLKETLQAFYTRDGLKGRETGEVSFPPYFPYLVRRGIPVVSSPIHNAIESLGLNDKADLVRIETALK